MVVAPTVVAIVNVAESMNEVDRFSDGRGNSGIHIFIPSKTIY